MNPVLLRNWKKIKNKDLSKGTSNRNYFSFVLVTLDPIPAQIVWHGPEISINGHIWL